MKLMFVRHAEPDYKHDSLTLKGHREAQLLSPYDRVHNLMNRYKQEQEQG